MSLEFNRRSFLKYSAAAAVAVAGSSLLVGCGENIVPANFQVEVTPKDSSKTVTTYHAYNTDGTGGVTLTKSNNYLKKDESLETELKVTNIKVADGDTIQVKFWPRPQASEGSQAYTRAFCTLKMVAKDNGTGSITLE